MPAGDNARLGFYSILGFQHEPTFGTFASITTTNFPLIEYESESLKFSQKLTQPYEIGRGGGALALRNIQMEREVSGDISYNHHPLQGNAVWIHALMRSDSVSSQTGATAHTIGGDFVTTTTRGLSITKGLPSRSLQNVAGIGGTVSVYEFRGCRINTFNFNASLNEMVKINLNIIGVDASSAGDVVIANATTTMFTSHRPYIWSDFSITIDGATETLEEFEFNINNNFVESRRLGTTTRDNIMPGIQELTLRIVQRFDTTTAYTRFTQNTGTSITVQMSHPQLIATTAAASTTLASINITFPRVYWPNAEPVVSDAGIVRREIDLIALPVSIGANNFEGIGVNIVDNSIRWFI